MTARVPFALIGVVLLLGSTTLAGTIHQPTVSEPQVDEELERMGAATQSTLRDAVTAAARESARNPITRRADTDYGQVLNESGTFLDALRVRIYLQLQAKGSAILATHDGIETRIVLPQPDSPSELRSAKQRVHVERRQNGTGLRVTIDDLTIVASRDGKRVANRQISPTVVVPTPTLAVHDRVSLFEERLNAGPLEPGLGRRLTASLYPVVWMRGYAQYGGAPIENVLANRHVSLFSNRAVLSLQRNVFGHSDPTGRAVFQRAFADAALTDVLGGIDTPLLNRLKNVQDRVGLTPDPADQLGGTASLGEYTTPDEKIRVGVNETAEQMFLRTLSDLNDTLEQTYTTQVELGVEVRAVSKRSVEGRAVPAAWNLSREETTTTVSVSPRSAEGPSVEGDSHLLEFHSRTVRRTTTTRRVWETPDGTCETVDRRIETFTVDLSVVGSHFEGPAPIRAIREVHERGGPLNWPNLAGIPEEAHQRLIAEEGGPDSLARKAVTDAFTGQCINITGVRPDGLTEWVYTDLAKVRERVANVSVTTTRADLAMFRANPARKIAQRLRDRRSEFVDAPASYGSVAERSRVAARTLYIDRLIQHFEKRAKAHGTHRAKLDGALTDAGGHSMDQMSTAYEERSDKGRPSPIGGIRMRVHASPGYLTTGAIGSEAVPTLPANATGHPLVVRNWNAITLPYGNIVDKVIGGLLGEDKTRLRSAGKVLDAIERSELSTQQDTSKLRKQVKKGVSASEEAAQRTVASFDLGDEESRAALVANGLEQWDGLGAQALAVTNGSAATRIHELAVDKWGDQLSAAERDLLVLRLEQNMNRAVADNRPNESPVKKGTNKFRETLEQELASRAKNVVGNVTKEKLEDIAGRELNRLPAGLPLAPAPGLWYATANLWQVRVKGEYVRFAVSVPRGTPDDPGARFLYLRDGSAVSLDVDGDGEAERLGRGERVSFETGTDVAIAVPPGACGVGDVDGQMEETSEGWPFPGGWFSK